MQAKEPIDGRKPDETLLQAAEHAYHVGDYKALAREIKALHGSQSPAVVTRVQTLQRAISIDPIHLWLLLACLLALFVIAGREAAHESGNEHGAASPRGSVLGDRIERATDQVERT